MKIVDDCRNAINVFCNRFLFFRKNIKWGNKLRIHGRIRICAPRTPNIVIGENVLIHSGWRENPSGGGTTHTLFYLTNNSFLKIGNNAGISNSTIVAHDSVIIGDNVNIGVNCVIYDTDFHSVGYTDRIERPDVHIKKAPVIIDDGAWVCGHCIILKGVRVGKRAVVAAGSVVTKSIPDGELWGGNPAKFIRKLE